jgi:hypothetical protein
MTKQRRKTLKTYVAMIAAFSIMGVMSLLVNTMLRVMSLSGGNCNLTLEISRRSTRTNGARNTGKGRLYCVVRFLYLKGVLYGVCKV